MNKNKVLSNLLWRFLERAGAQGVTLLVSIVLARLLDPEVYGIIAIVMVLITILNVFVDSGLGNALIQKKKADDIDFSTVFYFNLMLCCGLYILLFISAPFISDFYGMPNLKPVIRVLGLTIIISGIKNVQQAYVSRNLLFKRFFFATLGGTVLAAAAGIAMAYWGFGVWALVFQYLLNTTVDTAILWITVKWRPKRAFSIQRFKQLFSYGWKLFAAQLLTVTYKDIRQLIIGKLYSSSDLAFYNQGDKIPGVIVNNINSSVDSVLFPTLSAAQSSIENVKKMTRRAIKVSSYLMMPMMMCLAVCAEPLVKLVFTEKWMPCIPYLRIFCLIYVFYPIHTANLNAINAVGHSEIYLKLEIIKDSIGLILILVTLKLGVLAIALGQLTSSLIATFINARPNKKLIQYTYPEQMKDLLPHALLAGAMGFSQYFLNYLPVNNLIILGLQVICGLIVYFGLSYLLKVETFLYLTSSTKTFISSIRKKEIKND